MDYIFGVIIGLAIVINIIMFIIKVVGGTNTKSKGLTSIEQFMFHNKK